MVGKKDLLRLSVLALVLISLFLFAVEKTLPPSQSYVVPTVAQLPLPSTTSSTHVDEYEAASAHSVQVVPHLLVPTTELTDSIGRSAWFRILSLRSAFRRGNP